MQVFASWWERSPARHVSSAVVVALLAVPVFGEVSAWFTALFGPLGFYWG